MPPIRIRFNVNDESLRDDFFDNTLPAATAALGEPTQPQWGNLTAQHMLEHLLLTFEISNCKIEFPCVTPPEKRDRMRAFLYSNRPIPKGFQAPFLGTGLPSLKFSTFTHARTELLEQVDTFLNAYKNNSLEKTMNPVFGLLGGEDWHRHHYKHCFHHLLQFNLICEQSK